MTGEAVFVDISACEELPSERQAFNLFVEFMGT